MLVTYVSSTNQAMRDALVTRGAWHSARASFGADSEKPLREAGLVVVESIPHLPVAAVIAAILDTAPGNRTRVCGWWHADTR